MKGPPGLTRPQAGAVAKIANIVANGAKDHDFNGVVVEIRGGHTGFDHVTEMRNNVRGLTTAIASIRGSLSNPALSADVRIHLQRALAIGEPVLMRMILTLTGQG